MGLQAFLKKIKYKFTSGVRSEETGGLLNYYTLKIRDKAIADELVRVFEKKLDDMNWSVYPSFTSIILVQICNYFAKTSNAEALLFLSGFNYVL